MYKRQATYVAFSFGLRSPFFIFFPVSYTHLAHRFDVSEEQIDDLTVGLDTVFFPVCFQISIVNDRRDRRNRRFKSFPVFSFRLQVTGDGWSDVCIRIRPTVAILTVEPVV